MRGKHRAHLGIGIGLSFGGLLYAVSRLLVPESLAVGSAIVGVCAGLGARGGGAFGSQNQLRVIIFGSMFVILGTEYAIYSREFIEHDAPDFTAFLVRDWAWAVHTVVFWVGGVFLGVRLLVGSDIVSDVLLHGDAGLTSGGTGTPCPRCESTRTRQDAHSLALICTDCGHEWSSKAPLSE